VLYADGKKYTRPYRLFFYSFNCNEPRHIHVQREDSICKFWLTPLRLARNEGFSARELNGIREVLTEHHKQIEEAWDEHCH